MDASRVTWGDLRVGAVIESYNDILLVVAVEDGLVILLLVYTAGGEIGRQPGKLEYWEMGFIGWQLVVKHCKLLQEAP